jgi:hypothetical protein
LLQQQDKAKHMEQATVACPKNQTIFFLSLSFNLPKIDVILPNVKMGAVASEKKKKKGKPERRLHFLFKRREKACRLKYIYVRQNDRMCRNDKGN